MKKKNPKKLVYPDWSRTAAQIVTRADEKGTEQRPVWKSYDWDSVDDTKVLYSLRVTLEVAGASYPFGEKFDSEEERETVRNGASRTIICAAAIRRLCAA